MDPDIHLCMYYLCILCKYICTYITFITQVILHTICMSNSFSNLNSVQVLYSSSIKCNRSNMKTKKPILDEMHVKLQFFYRSVEKIKSNTFFKKIFSILRRICISMQKKKFQIQISLRSFFIKILNFEDTKNVIVLMNIEISVSIENSQDKNFSFSPF